jgi:hypothetical protein
MHWRMENLMPVIIFFLPPMHDTLRINHHILVFKRGALDDALRQTPPALLAPFHFVLRDDFPFTYDQERRQIALRGAKQNRRSLQKMIGIKINSLKMLKTLNNKTDFYVSGVRTAPRRDEDQRRQNHQKKSG